MDLTMSAFDDLVDRVILDESEQAAAIDYAPRYKEALQIFISILHTHEISQRALILTQEILAMNPAQYIYFIKYISCSVS
jgi:hypothetical protein